MQQNKLNSLFFNATQTNRMPTSPTMHRDCWQFGCRCVCSLDSLASSRWGASYRGLVSFLTPLLPKDIQHLAHKTALHLMHIMSMSRDWLLQLAAKLCLLSRLFGVKGQQSVISGMSSNHSLWCVFWEKCFNISKRRFTCFTETCCVPFLLSLYFVLSRVRNILETPRWAVWRFMKNIFKHEATMALTSLLSHNKNTCLVYTQSKYSGREYTQWWMRYS